MSWFYKPKQPEWTFNAEEKRIIDELVKLWEEGELNKNEEKAQKLESTVFNILEKVMKEQLAVGQLVYTPIGNRIPFVSVRSSHIKQIAKHNSDGKQAFIMDSDGTMPRLLYSYSDLRNEMISNGWYQQTYIIPRFGDENNSEKLIRALFRKLEVMFVQY